MYSSTLVSPSYTLSEPSSNVPLDHRASSPRRRYLDKLVRLQCHAAPSRPRIGTTKRIDMERETTLPCFVHERLPHCFERRSIRDVGEPRLVGDDHRPTSSHRPWSATPCPAVCSSSARLCACATSTSYSTASMLRAICMCL